MQSPTDILASLDRALADADECKIATNSEAPQPAETAESYGVEGHSHDASLVAIQPPSPQAPIQPSASPSTSPDCSTVTPPQSQKLQDAKAKARASSTGPWRTLWPHQKLARAFVAAEEQGGISFTLNLSTRLQATLAKGGDPARLMSHYIGRELRNALGCPMPYAFTFEVSPAGRLHVHGVLVPMSFEEDHVLSIDRALGKAGGKLKASNIVRLSQSYLGTLYDGLGWHAYLLKSGDSAAQFLGTDKVTFISAPLRKMCGG